MVKDLFNSLGLTPSATIEEIKKAYRQLAKEYHPDKNKDGAEKFKEINHAYSILIDPEKKRDYILKFGTQEEPPRGRRGFTAGDFYDDFFGGAFNPFNFGRQEHAPPPRPAPPQKKPKEDYQIFTTYEASLEEIYTGATVRVSYEEKRECPTCHGNPRQSNLKKTEKCERCDGRGTTTEQVGQKLFTQSCVYCVGKGHKTYYKPCNDCHNKPFVNKTVSISIPKGVHNEMKVKVKNRGLLYPDGKTRGTLIILIKERKEHPVFKRDGDNLSCNVKLSLKEAIMGFKNKKLCKHLDGRVIIASHNMGDVIKPGAKRMISREGMPIFNSTNDARGDLTITFKIEFPDRIQVPKTKEARQAIDALFETDEQIEAKENAIVIDDEEPITIPDDDNEMKEASEHETEFYNISDEEEEEDEQAKKQRQEAEEEEEFFSNEENFPRSFNVFL